MFQNALMVVARQPVPGQTKTRLSPPLSSKQAADLYTCFLSDTLETIRRVPNVRLIIGFSPQDAQGYFRELAPDIELLPQHGTSLGERLDNLLTEVLLNGVEKAVVLDSDSPSLPDVYLSMAFEHLDSTDVVLGPTQDGGYYLIGMKKPHPQLLRQVPMSTPHVLQDTLSLAAQSGLSASLLPTWYDIDTVDDLHQLQADLNAHRNGTGVRTRHWLTTNSW